MSTSTEAHAHVINSTSEWPAAIQESRRRHSTMRNKIILVHNALAF